CPRFRPPPCCHRPTRSASPRTSPRGSRSRSGRRALVASSKSSLDRRHDQSENARAGASHCTIRKVTAVREFAISFDNLACAGTFTLVFVQPATAPNPNLEFLRYWVGQSANATSAQQRIEIDTQVSSWPTAMSSAVVNKLKP